MTENTTPTSWPAIAGIEQGFKPHMPRAERRKIERASKKGDKKLTAGVMPLVHRYYEFIYENRDSEKQVAKFNELNSKYLQWLTLNREYKFSDFKNEFTERVMFMLQGINAGVLE